jgi:hypothetical protein
LARFLGASRSNAVHAREQLHLVELDLQFDVGERPVT